VPCSFRVTLPSRAKVRVDATLKILTSHSWQIASCGPGSKGDRRYAFAWLATAGPRHFLLIRRSLTNPAEVAYFFCFVPEHVPATLGVLVAVCGRRWTVEEHHEFGKDQFGFAPNHHRPTSDSSHRPWSRSHACSTCSPARGGLPSTTCTGRSGDAATKPALAGTTIEPGSHDQLTRYRWPARRRVAGRRRGRGDATAAAGGLV
jgi:hypothetical protein